MLIITRLLYLGNRNVVITQNCGSCLPINRISAAGIALRFFLNQIRILQTNFASVQRQICQFPKWLCRTKWSITHINYANYSLELIKQQSVFLLEQILVAVQQYSAFIQLIIVFVLYTVHIKSGKSVSWMNSLCVLFCMFSENSLEGSFFLLWFIIKIKCFTFKWLCLQLMILYQYQVCPSTSSSVTVENWIHP